jgi:hypothetical protein
MLLIRNWRLVRSYVENGFIATQNLQTVHLAVTAT